MIRTIKNLSQGENFNIEMKVTPIKKENETFEFSNSIFLEQDVNICNKAKGNTKKSANFNDK